MISTVMVVRSTDRTLNSGTEGSADVRVKFFSVTLVQLSMTIGVISPCVTSHAPLPSSVTFFIPFSHMPICFVWSGFSSADAVLEI